MVGTDVHVRHTDELRHTGHVQALQPQPRRRLRNSNLQGPFGESDLMKFVLVLMTFLVFYFIWLRFHLVFYLTA